MEDFETDDVDGDVARDAMRLIAMGRAFLRGGKCEGDDADVVAAHKVRSIHWSTYDPVRVVNADP